MSCCAWLRWTSAAPWTRPRQAEFPEPSPPRSKKRMGRGYYSDWAPYVPVAQRRRQAERKAAALKNKGQICRPVAIEGRTIARSFWGKAWCDNLEAYSDFANRLPRGRT